VQPLLEIPGGFEVGIFFEGVAQSLLSQDFSRLSGAGEGTGQQAIEMKAELLQTAGDLASFAKPLFGEGTVGVALVIGTVGGDAVADEINALLGWGQRVVLPGNKTISLQPGVL
jgi:hypothetical protein